MMPAFYVVDEFQKVDAIGCCFVCEKAVHITNDRLGKDYFMSMETKNIYCAECCI